MTTPAFPQTNFSLANNESITELIKEEYDLLYEVPTEVVVFLSIAYGGISFIAVVGNILVIWIVATTRQMHTVTNMYIANLALADVTIGMFCIPFQFQAALLQRWNLPDFMCAFCPFVQVVSVNVSVFTLTAIAIDRHRAIINPLRARPTKFVSKGIILAIWLASISFAIPMAIALRVQTITEEIRRDNVTANFTRPFCEYSNLTKNEIQAYRYYLVVVQYIIPFCIISFVYIQMSLRLWGSRTPGNAQDARDLTLLKNKKKVIKMLIIVVVVFGICWLPLQTYNIIHVTWPEINEYIYINIIWFFCDWLAMSNSCYNPFIYGIYNEKFKRELNRRFSFCFCRFSGQDAADRTMSVYTRASSIRSNYTNSSNRYRNNALILQQRNSANAKMAAAAPAAAEGYNVITADMDNQRSASVMNNNRLLCNGDKMMSWADQDLLHVNGDVPEGRREHEVPSTVLARDCICNPIGVDEWNQTIYEKQCMLKQNGTQARTILRTGARNGTSILRNKRENARGTTGDRFRFFRFPRRHTNQPSVNSPREMNEYCVLRREATRSSRTRDSKSSVTFNNM